MGSLSERDRDTALKATMFLCMRQLQSREPEEQGAHELGFGSIEAMQIQLRNWGAPDWVTQGADAGQKPKVEQPGSEPQQETAAQDESNAPRARTSGEVEELPLARDAIPLFREALEDLARANEELKYRLETRQGRHYPYRIASRKTPSDGEWAYFAGLLGLDSVARKNLYFGGGEIKYGTSSRAPLSPLPELIGTYLLAGGGDVEPLVKALHPKSSEPNWSEITRYIEGAKVPGRKLAGIESMALRLAILIRGDENKPGQPPPGESSHNLNLSDRIAAGLEAGVPRRQLYEEMLTKFGLSEKEFPWSEFCRLADLGLELPRSAEEP